MSDIDELTVELYIAVLKQFPLLENGKYRIYRDKITSQDGGLPVMVNQRKRDLSNWYCYLYRKKNNLPVCCDMLSKLTEKFGLSKDQKSKFKCTKKVKCADIDMLKSKGFTNDDFLKIHDMTSFQKRILTEKEPLCRKCGFFHKSNKIYTDANDRPHFKNKPSGKWLPYDTKQKCIADPKTVKSRFGDENKMRMKFISYDLMMLLMGLEKLPGRDYLDVEYEKIVKKSRKRSSEEVTENSTPLKMPKNSFIRTKIYETNYRIPEFKNESSDQDDGQMESYDEKRETDASRHYEYDENNN